MTEDSSIIDIDDLQLDKEVLRQPKEMLRAGKKLAKARLRYNEAKATVDVVAASLSHRIRSDPESFGLEKLTEPTIEAAVIKHKKHQEAMEEMNQAKYKLDMIEAMVTALHHRKTALELRVQLLGLEYYSEPSERKMGKSGEELRKRSVRKSMTKDRDW
jgi:hypothetical protein